MLQTIKTYFFVFGIVCALGASSQNQIKADSLKVLLEKNDLTKEEKLDVYYWLSTYSSSPEEELHYGTLLLDLANNTNNKEYLIKAHLRIGIAERLLGNLARALSSLFEGAKYAAEKDEFRPLLADIYIEISTCYTQNGNTENALLYGSKTVDILRKTEDKQRLALTLLNVGYDYYLIDAFDSALLYYMESEPIFEEIGVTIGLAYIKGNRALVYWKKGDLEQAKQDLFTAIQMLEPLGDRYGMADYYNQLGNIFLEEGNHSEAIKYTTQGLKMAEEEGLKEQVRDASYLLFSLYQSIDQYQKAIEFQTQYYTYKDSIQNLETTQEIANLRTGFEVGRKQAEVDLLLEQKRNNQIIMVTGGVALLIVGCLALLIFYYSRSKMQLNRQLEEQKNTLEELNSTKDKFFSIISHDLRGPVNILSGLVSVTKFFVDDKNPAQLKDALGKMEDSVDRLVKLLDNLLQWALHQRGHFPYVPENVHLNPLLTEVADMFNDMAVAKNIDLNLHLNGDLTLFVDKNTASTIFRNLFNNAIKFTNEQGQIEIQVGKNEETNKGIIKFKDNGVGIPKAKLHALFKLDSTLTTRGTSGETGLGLGLSLVNDFVELNKGKISVESEESKGTTFTVELPLGAELPPPPSDN